jgi:NADPH:quinone reductase-like Zn-dependent oxidoreductase
MMKAIVCKQFGPPELLSLETVEPRALQCGEVRIDVHACGINFPDILIVQGKYQVRPELPFFPGGEVAVRQNFAELKQLFAHGKIQPQIDTIYPLEEAAAALMHVGERRAVGKVVVALREPL